VPDNNTLQFILASVQNAVNNKSQVK